MSPEELKKQLELHLLWLDNANGERADLSGADLSFADLSGADLSFADLSGADLSDAILFDAILRGADLNGAKLRGADLSFADLSGADLSDAILFDAILRGADLNGAKLRGAILSGADLRGAKLPDGTQWTPDTDMTRFTDQASKLLGTTKGVDDMVEKMKLPDGWTYSHDSMSRVDFEPKTVYVFGDRHWGIAYTYSRCIHVEFKLDKNVSPKYQYTQRSGTLGIDNSEDIHAYAEAAKIASDVVSQWEQGYNPSDTAFIECQVAEKIHIAHVAGDAYFKKSHIDALCGTSLRVFDRIDNGYEEWTCKVCLARRDRIIESEKE